MESLKKYGVTLPGILLPKKIDLESWSVIACDQFTSDKAYWDRVRRTAGDAPSTINLILPEAELKGAPYVAASMKASLCAVTMNLPFSSRPKKLALLE